MCRGDHSARLGTVVLFDCNCYCDIEPVATCSPDFCIIGTLLWGLTISLYEPGGLVCEEQFIQPAGAILSMVLLRIPQWHMAGRPGQYVMPPF